MPILKDNKKYCYAMEFAVRDYELDSEKIVNNANYLHYMEHTRHSFCEEAGLSFTEMSRRGIMPVVRKIEIEYKSSLRGGDRFHRVHAGERHELSSRHYQEGRHDSSVGCGDYGVDKGRQGVAWR